MAWVIVDFSPERATGRVRDDAGREASFPLEVWWPCDQVTARTLEDSDARRYLLSPQPGEPVEIAWKRSSRGEEIPSRVARLRALERLLPPRAFLPWLAEMAEHVGPLVGWRDAEWEALFLDYEIAEAVRSERAMDPVNHLGLLAWIAANDARRRVTKRLTWIGKVDAVGAVALEGAYEHPVVYVTLVDEKVAALVDARLVLRVGG